MVHISDGILSPEVWIAGYIITIVILAFSLRKMKTDDIPKLSVITAAIFVASLIHIPVGPTSAHFVLNGLAGVLLGIFAYPCIFIALVLQAFLFQHGGITTIGINTVNTGIPALIAYGVFKLGTRKDIPRTAGIFGGIAGGVAVTISVLFLSLELVTTGEVFENIAIAITLAHLPVIIIEAIATGTIAAFFVKVKPEILGGH